MAINTATNFNIGANLPIDDRLVVNTYSDLVNLLAYEGLISYVLYEKTEYIYQDGVWKKYEKEDKAVVSSTAPTSSSIWFDISESPQEPQQTLLLHDGDELLPDSLENDILIDENSNKLLEE